MHQGLPYPDIDPVLIHIGPFPIRWYALAYIAGILLGTLYAFAIARNDKLWTPGTKTQAKQPRPNTPILEDTGFLILFGIILGGRLGYIIFYNFSLFWKAPLDILKVWNGGMSFHGGLIGVALAMIYVIYKHKFPVLRLSDMVAPTVPIGLFLGRLANFINAELYGRPTDLPWGMVFPTDSSSLLRHPSQLYEAGLEGILLFIILYLAVYCFKSLTRPGLTTGLFLFFYGLSRVSIENVRIPDFQMPQFLQGKPLTMGILLSLPMIIYGAYLIFRAFRKTPVRFYDLKPASQNVVKK